MEEQCPEEESSPYPETDVKQFDQLRVQKGVSHWAAAIALDINISWTYDLFQHDNEVWTLDVGQLMKLVLLLGEEVLDLLPTSADGKKFVPDSTPVDYWLGQRTSGGLRTVIAVTDTAQLWRDWDSEVVLKHLESDLDLCELGLITLWDIALSSNLCFRSILKSLMTEFGRG